MTAASPPSSWPRGAEIWNDVFHKNTSVVTREIAGEILLVPVRGELAQLHKLFTLNQVGAFIWEQIDGRIDLATLHRRLVDRFEVSDEEARQDILDYVKSLWEARLVDKLEDP